MRGLLLGLYLSAGLLPAPLAAETLDMPRADEATDYLSPKVMAEARPQWRPATGQAGASWGGFLVWPSAKAGALLDTNPLQLHRPGSPDAGLRIAPALVAERDGGVHDTVFYANADARLYAATPRADQLDGRMGALHDWAISRDLIVRLQGDLFPLHGSDRQSAGGHRACRRETLRRHQSGRFPAPSKRPSHDRSCR